MPYFRFTLIYEGGFASRLISGHGNLIVEPRIREVFLSDLRALDVRMPAATDHIRIYEAGSISLDFAYDPNEKGLGYGRYLYVENNQNRDSRILAVKRSCSIYRITLSQISFLPPGMPLVDSTYTVNNRSKPERMPSPSVKKRPLPATDAHRSVTTSPQNNFKRIRLSNGMTTAQFKDSRLKSIDNTLKSLSLIKTEPSTSPGLLATSLSSNKAVSIHKRTTTPDSKKPSITSRSKRHFPKLESGETSIPALLKQVNHAKSPRGPNSMSAILPMRPQTYNLLPYSAEPSNHSARKQYSTYTRQPTSPDPTKKLSTTQRINHFTRELWDTRREISAAQAREGALEMNLRSLDPRHGSLADLASDILESKAARERRLDMENRLQAVEAALTVEQKRREVAEKSLADVERECRAPFVVPALLQTFVKISQIGNDPNALDGISR